MTDRSFSNARTATPVDESITESDTGEESPSSARLKVRSATPNTTAVVQGVDIRGLAPKKGLPEGGKKGKLEEILRNHERRQTQSSMTTKYNYCSNA